MAAYTPYKHLEKPISTEKYNIAVVNKNNDIIDSELHKLEMKNQSQDELLATKEALSKHITDKTNPHGLDKNDIGLNNVDNTSDLDKPVSFAQQNAISEAVTQSNLYTDIKITPLINDAPETLDTLKKIADAIEENEAVVEALDTAIRNKVNQTDILKNIESINGNTTEGKLVDALVVKEVFQSVSNGKQLVASAITDKGVNTEATDTFEIMAENIKGISSEETGNIESPLICNFYFNMIINLQSAEFRFYFPIKKAKKMIIKSLCFTGSKTREASNRNVYFQFYGKKNGRTLKIQEFGGTIDSIGVKTIINLENIEIDISSFESLEYFYIYTPSVTQNYLYGFDLQSCIFELYP